MNQNNGTIGAIALYLLFVWLISAACSAWLTERKGYGERLGLLFGLVLSAVGLVIALLLPGRPGSTWRREGPFPRRRRATGS
jgi:O-antigen ligase